MHCAIIIYLLVLFVYSSTLTTLEQTRGYCE
nr:MAG TPA: APC repeat containing protein [Caudoviricetes sp.]